MKLIGNSLYILFLFFTSCGVFIRQPKYQKLYEPKEEFNGNTFKYWDGGKNFINQNIFSTSDFIIICVPGLGAHTGSFNFLQKYFSEKNISTVGIDLRGFGHWSGKKGDVRNIGLHIADLNQVIDYYIKAYPSKKILLLGESLGSSLILWYCSFYPTKIDGLILTSIVTNKGENDIKLRTIVKLFLGYTFCPTKPVLLDYDPTIYSNDPDFIKWAFEIDTLGTDKISPRYLIQSNRIINQSYKFLYSYEKPTLILQGGKDFLSEKKDINKIIEKCHSSKIQFNYFPDDPHSLVNDKDRNDVFNTMIEWINRTF
jgi:alpha-beta hydrolase superfamily lysophospholipase